MKQSQVQVEKIYNYDYNYRNQSQYQTHPQNTPVIKGYFPKEDKKKEMAIKQVNTTLTVLLGICIMATAISYYFATANEIVLNDLNRQTVILNDENSDLQNKLDKLKSFNNVDITMQKSNMLQKAQQVIETTAVPTNITPAKKINAQRPFAWSIGY